MNRKKALTARILVVGVVFFAISAPLSSTAVLANGAKTAAAATDRQAPSLPGDLAQGHTPLQQALQAAVEERGRAGLPIPSAVSYSYGLSNPVAAAGPAGGQGAVTVAATTVIQFDDPGQAGLDRWPDFVVGETLPAGATGSILAGDYSTAVRDRLTKAFPGIWDRYVFGYEPRTITFNETMTVLYPDEAPQAAAVTFGGAQASAADHDLVMGISTSGPRFDYALEYKWQTCLPIIGCVTLAEAKVGFELDWDIGLRLPITAALAGSNLLSAGRNPLSLAMTGRDWSAQQFQQVGLPGVNGNEFLLRFVFFVGARASIGGVQVLNAAVEAAYDGSRSFTTPMGLGSSFPLPALDLPPDLTGLVWEFVGVMSVGIGLSIAPHLEAGGITADWLASGDAAGSGSLAYNGSGSPAWFATINTGNFSPATNYATIRLSSFRYRFDQFTLALGGYLQFELFGYGVRSGTFTLPAFDLTPLTGGLWLNPHPGTPADLEERFLVLYKKVYLPVIVRR